jgi:hypothetical protein
LPKFSRWRYYYRQNNSARCQMQKSTALKFHRHLPSRRSYNAAEEAAMTGFWH